MEECMVRAKILVKSSVLAAGEILQVDTGFLIILEIKNHGRAFSFHK